LVRGDAEAALNAGITRGIREVVEDYLAGSHLLSAFKYFFAGRADRYNNYNRSAMNLNKKCPLAALYFRDRIIQGHFPLRAFIAPNMGNPFRGLILSVLLMHFICMVLATRAS